MESPSAAFARLADEDFGLINNGELAARLTDEEELILLDIRKQADWNESRIHGSVHCEWEDVGEMVDAGRIPAGSEIVVICYVGKSSALTAGLLRAHGWKASTLLDGFNGWKEGGYPVEDQRDSRDD